MIDGGPALDYVEKIRAHYPMNLHGVGMGIGSSSPLNKGYLTRLKRLIKHIQPVMVSGADVNIINV